MRPAGTTAASLRRRQWTTKPRTWVAAITISGTLLVGVRCLAPTQTQSDEGDNGEKIFMQNNCFVCHGQQGFGGIGPAFRNDPFLLLTDYVASQIILGRGVMPAFGPKLNDKQIAAVASYVRTSWGNQFGVVKPEEVARVRGMLDAFRQRVGR